MRKIIKYLFILLAFPWMYGFILNFINPPITITQFNSILNDSQFNRDYLSSDEIPQNALWCVVSSEDQNFAKHHGFDIDRIKEVYAENKKGKKLKGGSTISQQVAKNVFLWQGRSWVRKGLEAYCTLALETVLPKRRILEIYLNISEMGIGTFGIGAASEYYFHKPASQLSKNEIARIVAALPSPKKYNVNPPSNYISKRAKWVERQMSYMKGDPGLREIIEGN